MFSSEKPKRKASSLVKNKPKEDMETTEEMPKSQAKGKNEFFFSYFQVIDGISGIVSWVLEQ